MFDFFGNRTSKESTLKLLADQYRQAFSQTEGYRDPNEIFGGNLINPDYNKIDSNAAIYIRGGEGVKAARHLGNNEREKDFVYKWNSVQEGSVWSPSLGKLVNPNRINPETGESLIGGRLAQSQSGGNSGGSTSSNSIGGLNFGGLNFDNVTDRAKDLARFNLGLTKDDRENAFGYRRQEIGQKGDVQAMLTQTQGEQDRLLSQTQGTESRKLEDLRQSAVTERAGMQLDTQKLMQQRGFDFTLQKQGQERAAAMAAFLRR